jgi:hypothetical protein
MINKNKKGKLSCAAKTQFLAITAENLHKQNYVLPVETGNVRKTHHKKIT